MLSRHSINAAPATTEPKGAAKAAEITAAGGRERITKRPAESGSDARTLSTSPVKRRRIGSRAKDGAVAPQEYRHSKLAKENTVKKSEELANPVVKKKTKKATKTVQKKAHLNPLPTLPKHTRPAPLLFVWGAGNFGQFGMGERALGECEKPTRNKLVEAEMMEGTLGGEGAGFEAVAAGGMYSLFIDEKGTVSDVRDFRDTPQTDLQRRFGLVERTTMLPSGVTQPTYPSPTSRANSWISTLLLLSHFLFRLWSTKASALRALLLAIVSPLLSARRETFVRGAHFG